MSYPELSECQLGFIGGGNIAQAMIEGFLHSGQIKCDQIMVSEPTDTNLKKIKELGCLTTNTNEELFRYLSKKTKSNNNWNKIVFVCVKPHVFKNGILSVRDIMEREDRFIIISVMAGITIDQLKDGLKYSMTSGNIKYVRLMPNTATAVGAGICGLSYANDFGHIEPSKLFEEFLTKLLSPIGLCQFVTENLINAVCGIGGSGIAFVYTLIHAMSDGGLKMGLPRDVANNIAAQTVLGAALMVQKSGKNPIVLRDEVTSPGGTTIYGLHCLEKGAFNSVIIDAIESATERAQQLS